MKKIQRILSVLLFVTVLLVTVSACTPVQTFTYATDLADGVQTEESEYDFSFSAMYKDAVCTKEVTCNGILLIQQEGRYHASLREGDNIIETVVRSGKNSETRTFTVTRLPAAAPGEFRFETDLSDGIVCPDEIFRFHASVLCDGSVCDLEVTCNGILLSDNGGAYSSLLHNGENEVTVVARQGSRSVTRSYRIIRKAEFLLSTTLAEESIRNDKVLFTAGAFFNEAPCPFVLTHNGRALVSDNGRYEATLDTGNNRFVLTARVGDRVESKEWDLFYDGFALITDLENSDTATAGYGFRAAASYGGQPCDLSVTVNGKTIVPDGTRYALTLVPGENRILLAAVSGNAVKEYVYTVRYVNEAPTLLVGMAENKVYRGSVFNFDIVAKDGLGKKLPASHLSFAADWNPEDGKESYVPVNSISPVWDDSAMTSFRIRFKGEEFYPHRNTPFRLKITATDDFGRSSEFACTMTYTPAQPGEKIGEAVFSLEGFSIECGYFIEPVWIPIYEGVPFSRTLTDLLTGHGWTYQYTGSIESGFYLASIEGLDIQNHRIADGIWDFVKDRGYSRTLLTDGSLGEFCFGSGSGWMYSVNGVYKNYGFSDYYPQDGDAVRVQFTVILGEDLGGGGALGGETNSTLLGDNPDYAPIMKYLACISADEMLDKTVYKAVLSVITQWNLSQEQMNRQLEKLATAYKINL